jgi:hypothetical protein
MRISVALAAVVLLGCARLDAQVPRVSMQGVWRVAEVTIPGAKPQTIVFGDSRPNLTIITPRHYSRVEVQSDGPRPIPADIAKATADELRAVWGPFVAEAGTYELTGPDVVTMKPIASKSPAAMAPGAFIVYGFKQTGDTIWLTQQKNQNGAFANPVTFKLVRVE